MQVLASRSLFQHVVSFMDGYPRVVAKFARAQRFRPRLEGRYPSSRGLLPQLAIICDEVEVLDALQKLVATQSPSYRNPETEFVGVVRCAVRFDKLKMLRWLETHVELSSYAFEADLMDIAVAHTKGVEIMQWLLLHHSQMKWKVSAWALRVAAYNGELTKLKWLHDHGFRGFSCITADDAACAGHTKLLRFLLENRVEGCTSRALDQAAAYGHIDVVRYLFEFINDRDDAERHQVTARASFAMTKAALSGHAEVVGFLGRRQCKPLHNTLLDVVAAGELQVLKELCRGIPPFTNCSHCLGVQATSPFALWSTTLPKEDEGDIEDKRKLCFGSIRVVGMLFGQRWFAENIRVQVVVGEHDDMWLVQIITALLRRGQGSCCRYHTQYLAKIVLKSAR
ncbi:SnRNA-activating protein complex subunit 3 [Phytophthora cinnamomi]|uniref:SnRNA-activating protein complex subunit 3 n=1 Tax=Phytophthora cinnamomi TaxID=4785 RepID=UPI003559DEDC|nr:SnRNA-activating protein complex subunit 3 [Phytophthora cinnamomi]